MKVESMSMLIKHHDRNIGKSAQIFKFVDCRSVHIVVQIVDHELHSTNAEDQSANHKKFEHGVVEQDRAVVKSVVRSSHYGVLPT